MKKQQLTFEDIPLPTEEAHFVVEYCKDLDVHRAARSCNIDAEDAFKMVAKQKVITQIQRILRSRLEVRDINADWLMMELYNLHIMCLQTGKLSTSHQVLKTIGSLGKVDAYAAEKVELKSDRDVIDRLQRERKRRVLSFAFPDKPDKPDDEPSFL